MAGGEHVYATLLLSDSYLPGALVLAHSLRDAQTTKKLAVLVTLDTVSADAVTQLKSVYDYVLPVPRIRNEQPSNLYLMNRADLHSAFTKINLWRQGQFSRIVYIDADVVAYRATDELFNIPHAFAAAPDIGWPDIFNTGVMVLTPNMGDYYAMMAMAERGISFDGADQGLLNMHFKNSFHRLSFTYNVTPSAHYQYIPAYRHFQSSINMVHFIGSNKPWFAGRNAPHGASPFDEMVGRWWAVYDRHYRVQEPRGTPQQTSHVQYFTQGEWQPQQGAVSATSSEQHHQQPSSGSQAGSDHGGGQHQDHGGRKDGTDVVDFAPQPAPSEASSEEATTEHIEQQHHQAHPVPGPAHTAPAPPAQPKPEPPPIPLADWDAQWQPPPADSKPEAINFPSAQYTMSQDPAPFVPPPRYPSPPRNMWYEVPKEPPAPSAQPPKHVFPWEGNQPQPSRTFPSTRDPLPRRVSIDIPQSEHKLPTAFGAPAETPVVATSAANPDNGGPAPSTPPTPTVRIHPPPAESWTDFQLNNAWDEVPEIGRYVEGLQKHRRARSQGSVQEISSPIGQTPSSSGNKKPRGLKLTDFPSAVERPSLPVTPAPVARPSFWGDDEKQSRGGAEPKEKLPTAEGVPAQSEWVCVHGRRWQPTDCLCNLTDLEIPLKDPEAQLQKLAKQQYEHLLRKLGGEQEDGEGDSSVRVIPKRSLPFGSEDVTSPTYIKQFAPPPTSVAPRPVQTEASTASVTISDGGQRTASGKLSPAAEGSEQSPQLLESPMPRSSSEQNKE